MDDAVPQGADHQQGPAPIVVVPTRQSPTAGAMPLALTSIAENPGKFFVSFANDPLVYKWDRTAATPYAPISAALDGTNFPSKIAAGPGETYYVLTVSGDLPTSANLVPAYSTYKVIGSSRTVW